MANKYSENEFLDVTKEILLGKGFVYVAEGDCYLKEFPTTTLRFNLRKSEFSLRYYVEMYFFLNKFHNKKDIVSSNNAEFRVIRFKKDFKLSNPAEKLKESFTMQLEEFLSKIKDANAYDLLVAYSEKHHLKSSSKEFDYVVSVKR